MGYGIGQSATRVEDRRFLTGRGRYVDDIVMDRQAHGAVVLSPHAHARIVSIDAGAALATPGVLAVLTGADLEAEAIGMFPPLFMPEDAGGPKGYRTRRPALCPDRVRCVGDRVAFVVAETPEIAQLAAEQLAIVYEPLPAVVGAVEAVAPDAPPVWADRPGNLAVTLKFGDGGRADAAFATAHAVASVRLLNNRLAPTSLEPRCCIGQYDPADESFILHTTSQNPHGARTMLAGALLRIPETRLRVVSPDVGGGFGMKADPYPEDLLVLVAARRCGRPVKYVATRSESMIADTHGRDQVIEGEMALDAEGRVLALRTRSLQAIGAYVVSAVMASVNFGSRLLTGPYDIQTVDITASAVFTHTAPVSVYRGAGRPEATYLIERLMDQAAHQLGMDPVELRRRNLIRPDQMPYSTATFLKYDSGEFGALMDTCLEEADWRGFAERRKASEANGRLRGRAVCPFIEVGGVFNDRMELRFDPAGGVTIVAGTHSHGQGHATVFAQLAAEWLGVPFEQVRYLQGDTAAVPFGRGTYAARSVLLGGNGLRVAVDAAIDRAGKLAAHLMKADPASVVFDGGVFRAEGTNQSMPIADVIKAFYFKAGIPREFGVGLDTVGSWNSDSPNFPNGCHVCEVEVDPETGVVRLDRYTMVDDAGRTLNPMICEGQIVGGFAQGVGQALMEAVVFDATGQVLSGSLMDYALPRAGDFPDLKHSFRNVPCTTNPIGVKSVGESGTIGAPPTVVNAILDALRSRGVTHIDMPATPARVWRALREAGARRQG